MEQQRPRHRDEAVELIECYLHQQDFAPHAKLPSERDMCQMWGLNRTTLRTAIRRLMERGVLYALKGSGTYVAAPRLERNLQDAKSTTESVRSAGRKLKTRLLERQVIEAGPYLSEKLQVAEGSRVLFLRRLRIMDGIPYMIEINYVNLEYCPRLVDYDFSEESLFRALNYHHIYPSQGKESVGITYATVEEARLLQIPEGEHLFFLTGVTRDNRGVTLEFFKSVARSDMVRFSSILRSKRSHSERSDFK